MLCFCKTRGGRERERASMCVYVCIVIVCALIFRNTVQLHLLKSTRAANGSTYIKMGLSVSIAFI